MIFLKSQSNRANYFEGRDFELQSCYFADQSFNFTVHICLNLRLDTFATTFIHFFKIITGELLRDNRLMKLRILKHWAKTGKEI